MTNFKNMLLVAAAVAAFPGLANAASVDVAENFETSSFQYGTYVNGVFIPFTMRTNDGTLINLSNGFVPQVVKNISNNNFTSGTVIIPAGTVYFHPGTAASGPVNGSDSVIRFIASTAGTYTLNGAFTRSDTTTNGNGVSASIFSNVLGNSVNLFSSTLAPTGGFNSSVTFSGLTASLGASDTIDFVLGNNGAFDFDGTRLSATISTPDVVGGVPEPSTWAMMLGGFGMVGGSMRWARRRKQTVRFTLA